MYRIVFVSLALTVACGSAPITAEPTATAGTTAQVKSGLVSATCSNWLDRDSFDVVVWGLRDCLDPSGKLTCKTASFAVPGQIFTIADLDEGVGSLAFLFGPEYDDQYEIVGSRLTVVNTLGQTMLTAKGLPASLSLVEAISGTFELYNDKYCTTWE